MSSPERRAELVQMAYDVLHRSCPTTERADYIDPSVARAIAMGYLELALMPSALWDDAHRLGDHEAQPDPWDATSVPGGADASPPVPCPDHDDEGVAS